MTTPVWVVLLLLVGVGWYLGLAGYVWRYRRVPGAWALIGMLLSVGVWTLCYALELGSRDVGPARWWSGLKFVGIVGLVPTLWAFVVRYTDAERAVPRAVLALMTLEPLAVLTLLAVPATHDLVHRYPGGELQRYAPYPVPEVGPLFWPHAIYTYLLLFSAIWVLCLRLSRITGGYRRAAHAIIVTTVLPLIGNLVFNSGLAGLDTVDPTPFLFTVTVSVLVWGFFRFRLVDLLPVARTAVLERLTDAVVVVDGFSRVLDANPAGARLLGRPRDGALGVPLADLVPALAEVVDAGQPGPGAARGSVVAGHAAPWRVSWGDDGAPVPVDLRLLVPGPGGAVPRDVAVTVTPLRERAPGPRAVVVRDVTGRKRVERRLRELLREQTALAQTLQESLRPSALPGVPGIALAARSLPAGREADDGALSGDFYDVHRAGPGRWAFVLGDVSGKGVHAAVVTALTRYTVRTLSAEGRTPSEVVARLNQALQSDDAGPDAGGERFCTLVYGHLVPGPGGEVTVTLALAGHPQPFVRRLDGTVEAVGEPGTVLGLLPDVDVVEAQVVLAPGDLLLAYTDGVTEARCRPGPRTLSIHSDLWDLSTLGDAAFVDPDADGGAGGAGGAQEEGDDQFGEARLAEVLQRSPADVSGAVGDVLRAVVSFAEERDDIAVLAFGPAPSA
ncbi:MAG: histidine kinase N-terminal 7TM domain-containing protein [Kineosporiaceae bacterium]